MNRIPLLIPPTRLMVEFSGIAAGLLQLGDTLVRANANLRTQRDLLLPKLISGEIDVSALSGEPVAEAAD